MKISLTRLLNEIKLTNKKIEKKLNEQMEFFDISTGGKLNTYKSVEDMKSKIDSYTDSLTDLTKLRDTYRSSLLKANNSTIVNVQGKSYTISELIAKKDVIQQEVRFVRNVREQLLRCTESIAREDDRLDDKLDNLIMAAMGKDRKTDPKEIRDLSEMFKKNNKVSLIDPCGLEEGIKKKEDELDEFINTVDFTLSEINAKTEVQV